jgi:hypothetical protein
MNNPFTDYIYRNGFQLHWKNRHGPVGLLIASAAMSAAGSIQQGQAAKAEAESQKNMSDYNAKLAEREAQAIDEKTKFDKSREAEAGAERMSSLKAALGASGAVSSAGSPLLIMAKQASENELAQLGISEEGRLAAQRARSEGALQTMQGKIYRQKGNAAQQSGYMQAGSTMLSAFGSMGGKGGGGKGSAPKASAYQGTGGSYKGASYA